MPPAVGAAGGVGGGAVADGGTGIAVGDGGKVGVAVDVGVAAAVTVCCPAAGVSAPALRSGWAGDVSAVGDPSAPAPTDSSSSGALRGGLSSAVGVGGAAGVVLARSWAVSAGCAEVGAGPNTCTRPEILVLRLIIS